MPWPAPPPAPVGEARPCSTGTARALENEEAGGGEFVLEVSNGLRELLSAQTAPMVLVGLEHLVAAHREVNSYEHLLADAVDHNADGLSSEELHRMAWPIVEQRLRDERNQVMERFHALHGTG